MRILITGGNGNISKILKNKLFLKHNITSISRSEFDLLNYKELEKYLSDKEFDILIHTAITGGRRTETETCDVVYKNLLMFENLIKFENKFKLIINIIFNIVINLYNNLTLLILFHNYSLLLLF